MRGRRGTVSICAVVLAATSLAACSDGVACPAVGVANTMTVSVTGTFPAGSSLRVVCDPTKACFLVDDETSPPETDGGTARLEQRVGSASTPESVTVSVLDPRSTAVFVRSTDVTWHEHPSPCGSTYSASVALDAP